MLNRIKKMIFNKQWYDVWSKDDNGDGWSKDNDRIIMIAKENGIRIGIIIAQGERYIGVYCEEEKVQELIKILGEQKYDYKESVNGGYYVRQTKVWGECE